MSLSHIDVSNEMPILETGGCRATREILDRIGDKWSLYIIALLANGPLRFNELKRRIEGISQRMLTLTLRGLERDGLISRTIFATIPPRVDYALTALGTTLLVPVMALVNWANDNQRHIGDAHRRYDEKLESVSTASVNHQQK
ncbi:helix-turn-helix domain-containing protein [Brenneria populi subsp. brevivirga]|uniref:winged helix-turn-helix transcriptional regulator n=1 Tax=Brenneria populi TaxID=1505588 RepID=UPI002E16BD1A|nr:helix-turn-helix domain-containing protein [Brenneria populi subsp. brevivirga]